MKKQRAERIELAQKNRKNILKGLYRPNGFPRTPFLMPDRSPWPIYCAVFVYGLFVGLATYFNNGRLTCLYRTAVFGLLVTYAWAADIVIESVYRGQYRWEVQKACRHGFCLFMLREWMFFVRFF